MTIRTATGDDLGEIRQLYYDTIMAVNSHDYSPEQLAVWASGYNNIEGWISKMRDEEFFVADIDGSIAGFASVTQNGYLDFMYVHKDFQRQGIATQLLAAVENYAQELRLLEITSMVSISAKPFFEQKGFTILSHNSVDVKGIKLTNFRAAKSLQK